MTYLLIIFVIALALAPLSYFAPSKRQREIARMREYAAVHGLFVEFRDLPGIPESAAPRRQVRTGDIIYYGKRRDPRRADGMQAGAWLRDTQGWRSLRRGTAVPCELQQLPAGVLAASADGHSCGVYWQESGGVDSVRQIVRLLDAWNGPSQS